MRENAAFCPTTLLTSEDAMVFEHIDKLKEEYTDKFVKVDENRPELKRFDGLIGRVKTVNMSGRALVEFDEWINNIGWYDIDLDFLKVVDESEVASQKESAKSKPAPQKKAEAKSAEKPAAKSGGGMSMEDILAAARGGSAPAKKEEKAAVADKGAERPAKSGGGQMSVADMLAAARAADSGEGAPAAETAKPAEKTPAPKAEEKPAATASSKKTSGGIDTSGMTVEQMLALARSQASGTAPAAAPKEPEPAKESPAEPEPAAAETPEPEPEPEKVPASSGELPSDVEGIVAFCRNADG